jgi:hypothetical protein
MSENKGRNIPNDTNEEKTNKNSNEVAFNICRIMTALLLSHDRHTWTVTQIEKTEMVYFNQEYIALILEMLSDSRESYSLLGV